MRGFLYEAAGTVEPELLEGGAEAVREAARRWRIPVEVVAADPSGPSVWAGEMIAATTRLIGRSSH